MDYKKETVEILQKINDDSLLEFFYRFIARGSLKRFREKYLGSGNFVLSIKMALFERSEFDIFYDRFLAKYRVLVL